MPRCVMCVINMPEGRLIKHHSMARCFKNTWTRLRRKDIEVFILCVDRKYNLTGKDIDEKIEGVALFNYLGFPLEQSYGDWPAVNKSACVVYIVHSHPKNT